MIDLILCLFFGFSGGYLGLRLCYWLQEKETQAKHQALLDRLNGNYKGV